MKRSLLALFAGFVLGFMLLAAAFFIFTLKSHAEQKQEHRQQELQEYIDQSMNECQWAYPLDLISRYRCYERLLG